MNQITRSHPESWLSPFRPLQSATLASDEILASILHYEIINTAKNNEVTHTMFAVVRKGDKAIARTIISHGEKDGYCQGHSADIAEYPIADELKLTEELIQHGLRMGIMLMKENLPLKLDSSKAAFVIKAPLGSTNQGMLNKFAEDTQPEGVVAKEVITTVLGLAPTTKPDNTAMITKERNESTAKNNLAKTVEEMELIKKYGRKPMQELAKKMNYRGEIINKFKSKINANQ